MEKEVELLRFEILEIESQLKSEALEDPFDVLKSEVAMLTKKVSTIFQAQPQKTRIFNPDAMKRTSTMFNNKFLDVKEKMDQQQAELDKFTKRGTDIARNWITSLSPKKLAPAPDVVADSSFMFENMDELSIVQRSVLLSDDEIDIDDYTSGEE